MTIHQCLWCGAVFEFSHNCPEAAYDLVQTGYWIVTTPNGQRQWYADDADHVLEQHRDAFGDDDPDEEPLFIVGPDGSRFDVGKGEDEGADRSSR